MAMDYILSCCSAVDLSEEQLKQMDVHYLCFHYELGGWTYVDDLGRSMSTADFYRAMEEGADTRTSQNNPEEYRAYFEPFVKEGKDVLHITLSSGISGTYNSAKIAAEDLMDDYPDRKIYVVDSLAASSGYGLLMDKLAALKKEGMGIRELRDWAEENKLRVRHWFFTSDLTFFIRGGRVSKTAGFVGNVLNICPLLDVSVDGKLIPRYKIRTKKKVIAEIVKRMEEQADDRQNYSGKVFISHSARPEDAELVAKLVREKFPQIADLQIMDIGTTIGAHTGPGTVTLFFWGDKRSN